MKGLLIQNFEVMKMIRRYLIHIPHGALAALLLGTGGYQWLGACWIVLIVSYQYLEDWKIDDKSYIDFRGYMIGYALVAVGSLILRSLSMLPGGGE